MTKEEFIARFGAPERMKTEYGLLYEDGTKRIAMECKCGEEGCQGWAMVYEEAIGEHKYIYQREGR